MDASQLPTSEVSIIPLFSKSDKSDPRFWKLVESMGFPNDIFICKPRKKRGTTAKVKKNDGMDGPFSKLTPQPLIDDSAESRMLNVILNILILNK